MEHINKIMVGFDLTDIDNKLFQYAAFISKVLNAQRVYFVYVDESDNEDDKLRFPFEGTIQDYISLKLKEHFSHSRVASEVVVLNGNPLQQLIKFSKEQSIDLAVVGVKREEEGSGVLPQRFTRKSPCSVLFVPENADLKIEKILLPTDFSDYSRMAFDEVAYFKKADPKVRILGQHVYSVPTGYYKTGKSYEQFAEIMKHNAEEHYRQFIRNTNLPDLGIEMHYSLHEEKTSKEIMDLARAQRVDLIIIGAKGHNDATVFLLGSQTEKLLNQNKEIPMFILKKKGETLGFLETISWI